MLNNILYNFIEVDIKDFDIEKEPIAETVSTDNSGQPPEVMQIDTKGSKNSEDNLFSHKFLFGVIFSRCRDVSATVRAKVFQ